MVGLIVLNKCPSLTAVNDATVLLLQGGNFHSNYSINSEQFRGKIEINVGDCHNRIFSRCVGDVMQSILSITSYMDFVFKLLQQ